MPIHALVHTSGRLYRCINCGKTDFPVEAASWECSQNEALIAVIKSDSDLEMWDRALVKALSADNNRLRAELAAMKAVHDGMKVKPPYPFCRHPDKCIDGKCHNDPVCND